MVGISKLYKRAELWKEINMFCKNGQQASCWAHMDAMLGLYGFVEDKIVVPWIGHFFILPLVAKFLAHNIMLWEIWPIAINFYGNSVYKAV